MKNNNVSEEVRGLKRECETQSVRLCEVVEKNKNVEEDKIMSQEDKR